MSAARNPDDSAQGGPRTAAERAATCSTNYSSIDLPNVDTRHLEFTLLPARIDPGTEVGGFRIVEEIGAGGMSTVFRAHQLSRDRFVALKVLSPHLAEIDSAVRRFREESRLAALLAHPGIVPVYGSGFDGTYYHYAMKLMSGPTLAEFIDEAVGCRGPEFFRQAASALGYLCRTVASLHAAGILHRDIKPANVYFEQGEKLILGDFSVACSLDRPAADATDGPHGSPAYMAPERFVASEDSFDVRSDVYSLGATLYELLTGVQAFPPAGDEEMARRKLNQRPPSPRAHLADLPLGLEAIIRQAMDPHVELRYRSATEMARDLERFVNSRRRDTRSHPGAGGYDDRHPEDDDREEPGPELATLI